MISIFSRLLLFSVIAFAHENYIINDIEFLKQNGWVLVDEKIDIKKRETVSTNLDTDKLFKYKNSSVENSECQSIKKGCTSSR